MKFKPLSRNESTNSCNSSCTLSNKSLLNGFKPLSKCTCNNLKIPLQDQSSHSQRKKNLEFYSSCGILCPVKTFFQIPKIRGWHWRTTKYLFIFYFLFFLAHHTLPFYEPVSFLFEELIPNSCGVQLCVRPGDKGHALFTEMGPLCLQSMK